LKRMERQTPSATLETKWFRVSPMVFVAPSVSICRSSLVVSALMHLTVQLPSHGGTTLLHSRRSDARLRNVSAVMASCCLPGLFCTSIYDHKPVVCIYVPTSPLLHTKQCPIWLRVRMLGECQVLRWIHLCMKYLLLSDSSKNNQSEAVFVFTHLPAISPNSPIGTVSLPILVIASPITNSLRSLSKQSTLAPADHRIDLLPPPSNHLLVHDEGIVKESPYYS
jgi:hypothetical protein